MNVSVSVSECVEGEAVLECVEFPLSLSVVQLLLVTEPLQSLYILLRGGCCVCQRSS